MRHIADFIEANRSEFGLESSEPILIEVRSPLRSTRTCRCSFFVRIRGEKSYRLVVQGDRLLTGQLLNKNPFRPNFHRVVSDLLPSRTGSFQIAEDQYYWAHFLSEPSLKALLGSSSDWSALSRAVIRLATAQCQEINLGADYLASYQQQLRDFYLTKDELPLLEQANGILGSEAPSRLPCAWSHGDLWAPDIFVKGESIVMIDWEWASESAPIGSDLIDLYVTTAEHLLRMKTADAWTSFLKGGVQPLEVIRQVLDRVWQGLNLEVRDRLRVVLFALWRSAIRVLAQDGSSGRELVHTYSKIGFQLRKNL